MNPCPKPTKEQRIKAKNEQKQALKKHRHNAYTVAAARDDNYCVFCYFLDKKKVRARDVHHVYGRGKGKESWREQYVYMLCTCRKCHPPPILGGPGTTFELRYVERVMVKANETPINKHFRHHGRK
jgi:hypothetical protein